MTTEMENSPFEAEAFVYIRHMDADEVKALLPPNALSEVSHPNELFAVTTADGVQIAVVEGREAAFAAALAHDLKPLSVH